MAMDVHLQTLNTKHEELEAAIATELKHPSHDDSKVHEMKRLKLKIKDQITELRQRST